MLVISVIISLLSVINFAMLYLFILKNRQRNLAVMRICGCTKVKAVLIYLTECLVLTLPVYFVGALLNIFCINYVFGDLHIKVLTAFWLKNVKVYCMCRTNLRHFSEHSLTFL